MGKFAGKPKDGCKDEEEGDGESAGLVIALVLGVALGVDSGVSSRGKNAKLRARRGGGGMEVMSGPARGGVSGGLGVCE